MNSLFIDSLGRRMALVIVHLARNLTLLFFRPPGLRRPAATGDQDHVSGVRPATRDTTLLSIVEGSLRRGGSLRRVAPSVGRLPP